MQTANDGRALFVNGFSFDPADDELRDASGLRVALRAQVLAVLQFLARNAGRVVTKDELMRAVWPDVVVTDDSLVQCVKELRRALCDGEHHIIETASKRGYRLVSASADAVAKAPFEQDIRFATCDDGTRIAYATSGHADARALPLVRAAHWMTHVEWDWRGAIQGPWIQDMSRRFRLVRYDGRGRGLSDRGLNTVTLDDEVSDLEAVVDAAGLDGFGLLGRSSGAPIAVRYAARHPRRVAYLILEGGSVRGEFRRGADSVPVEEMNALAQLIRSGWGRDNAAFRQLITSMMFPGVTSEQAQSFNHLQFVASTPEDAAVRFLQEAEYDVSDDVAQVRCPTLVLHSPRDNIIPFEEGRLLAATIPGARLELVDSPNHVALPGEPAYQHVKRLMDTFIAEHAGEKRQRPPQARAPARVALRQA